MNSKGKSIYCTYCDPYRVHASHIPERIARRLSLLWSIFYPIDHLLNVFPSMRTFANRLFGGVFVRTLLIVKILQEVDVADNDQGISGRSLVVVREAGKRGIPIKSLKFFGKHGIGLFSLEINGKKKIFDGLPHAVVDHSLPGDFNDKSTLKSLLKKEKIPYPKGEVFRGYAPALQYVMDRIGFPVVVKPSAGSLSRHTICDIKTTGELKEAIRIVKLLSQDFIVEEFIDGDVHRITLVNGAVVASCRREPPNIIGDGIHTVRELVDIKNDDPRRGSFNQKNYTLHKILLEVRAAEILESQGVNLESIIPKGIKIYLHDKVILSAGADIHDTTDILHPDNITLFEKVYAIYGLPVIGIDFIAKDISRSYRSEKTGVIEVNSLPYIDMHHYPVTGTPRNVAGHILDYCILSR